MPVYQPNEPFALLASAARTGTTKSATDTAYGSAVRIANFGRPIRALVAELDVTAAAKEAGDKLDVAVQTLVDGNTDDGNWVDVIAFTQVLGNGGAKRYFAKIAAVTALTMFEAATALTAGNIRDLIGEQLRVKYAITNDADDPVDTSFTFAVFGMLV